MRKHRWIKTAFTEGGGLNLIMKYGTTDANATIILSYPMPPSTSTIPMLTVTYQNPRLQRAMQKVVAVDFMVEPKDLNSYLWAVLRDFETECVKLIVDKEARPDAGSYIRKE